MVVVKPMWGRQKWLMKEARECCAKLSYGNLKDPACHRPTTHIASENRDSDTHVAGHSRHRIYPCAS